MPSTTITIKPNNHRIHPCANDKKIELLNLLLSQNSSSDTIVVTSADPKVIKELLQDDSAVVMSDKEFITSKELTCELVISFDVPDKAIIYSARVAKATDRALLLLDKSEQKKIHPIETLLGRAIKQEVIEGFEYFVEVKEEDLNPVRKMTKVQIKEEAKKRYDKVTGEPKPKREYNSDDKKSFDKPKRDYKSDDRKSYDKPKRDYKSDDKKSYDKPKRDYKSDDKYAKKDRKPNQFLGKDENGKAIFSGKSGDRNHRYDGTPQDKWGAPKKVGRKINIKALKKKED